MYSICKHYLIYSNKSPDAKGVQTMQFKKILFLRIFPCTDDQKHFFVICSMAQQPTFPALFSNEIQTFKAHAISQSGKIVKKNQISKKC